MSVELARNSTTLFDRLHHEIDRFWGDLFDYDVRDSSRPGSLACNVWEDSDALYVECELPGVSKDRVDVNFADRQLTIRAERSVVRGDDETEHRVERVRGEFQRGIHIPVDVQHESLDATLKDGILTVKLPKAESIKARKIVVT